MIFFARIQRTASANATHAPVIDAVRVPPSACMTSQSMSTCRSPRHGRSHTLRRARPIRRCISCVRPLTRPVMLSRAIRTGLDRGSIPYSAVTQPSFCPLRNRGTRSSTVAVHRTFVRPISTSADPSAYSCTLRRIETRRISSGFRPSGRCDAASPINSPSFTSILA